MAVTPGPLHSAPASTRQAPTCPGVLWAARPWVRVPQHLHFVHPQTVPSHSSSPLSAITWTGRPPASSSPPRLTCPKVLHYLACPQLSSAAGTGCLPPPHSPAPAQQSPAQLSSPDLPPWPPSRGYQHHCPCGGRLVPIPGYQQSLSPRQGDSCGVRCLVLVLRPWRGPPGPGLPAAVLDTDREQPCGVP